MKEDKFLALVSRQLYHAGPEEIEDLISSQAFLAVYQQVQTMAEGRWMACVGKNLGDPVMAADVSRVQGIVMGMRMALDHFVQLSEPKEESKE